MTTFRKRIDIFKKIVSEVDEDMLLVVSEEKVESGVIQLNIVCPLPSYQRKDKVYYRVPTRVPTIKIVVNGLHTFFGYGDKLWHELVKKTQQSFDEKTYEPQEHFFNLIKKIILAVEEEAKREAKENKEKANEEAELCMHMLDKLAYHGIVKGDPLKKLEKLELNGFRVEVARVFKKAKSNSEMHKIMVKIANNYGIDIGCWRKPVEKSNQNLETMLDIIRYFFEKEFSNK